MARTVSGDVNNPPYWVDAQWTAILQLCSQTRIIETVSTVFYRPYEAAARFFLSPDRITQRSEGGISETYLSTTDLVAELRALQEELDAQIPLGDDTSGATTLRCFVGDWE